jgi:anti-anti-sigma regulatory factor
VTLRVAVQSWDLPDSPLRAAYTSSPPTLFLAGEIDESTYPDLLDVLDLAAATSHHRLQVDMAEVVYCDLAGLRAIISLAPAGRPGSASVDQLVIRHLSDQLRTVIRVLGWDTTPGLFLTDVDCR